MTKENWELASWIATTFGFLFTILGLVVVIIQLFLQRRQNRLETLDKLYSTLDTPQARLYRKYIYDAKLEELSMSFLDSDTKKENHKQVEETIASLERFAYRIKTKQVPSLDAFNLYGGVLLSIAYKVMPYINEQREMRAKSKGSHKLQYRRYFEALVREWCVRYAKAINIKPPSRKLSTQNMLEYIFAK